MAIGHNYGSYLEFIASFFQSIICNYKPDKMLYIAKCYLNGTGHHRGAINTFILSDKCVSYLKYISLVQFYIIPVAS